MSVAIHSEEIQEDPDRTGPGELQETELQLVTQYIEANFQRDISLGELAAIAFMSQFHFSRLFKRATGFSPYQYLLRYRVEKSKPLLRANQFTINKIAYLVGFGTPGHFSRYFRKITGVLPSEY